MIEINGIKIGDGRQFALIAGPCVIENEKIILETASAIQKITAELGIPFIFKSSYKKANRTSINSFVGIELAEALKILLKVKNDLGLTVLTDVHTEKEVADVSPAVDIIQIPAFLCRQTELLIAAGRTGKVVNVKKGQFLAPEDMEHVAAKISSTGNKKIMLTERGSMFGYHNLVVDFRSLEIMRQFGYPVVIDATHAVQIPSKGGISSGDARFISTIAKAAVAVGVDAVFMEVHPDPPNALSDAASQLPLNQLKDLLKILMELDKIAKNERRKD